MSCCWSTVSTCDSTARCVRSRDSTPIFTGSGRGRDAYAALQYLQSQPFVRSDRIAAMGWSQGGGVTLYSIAERSAARPADLPQGDFRAAIAFYPGACNEARQPGWTSTIPLLVLTGDADVWTPMAPCKTFVDAAVARGNNIEKI